MQPRPRGSILAVMQPGSHRDRIIEAIRISSRPLDDDQLADRTGISPRQSVNQICRELARAGLVRRRPGLGGKIVNEWLGDHGRQADSGPAASDAGVSRTAVLTDVAAIRLAASCRRAARVSSVTLSG